MLSRNDLQRLSQLRLEDAIYLLQGNKASSAYYLAGYSVELALKACISKIFQAGVIPDKGFVNAIYTHDLESLMKMSGLLPELNARMKEDPAFGGSWGVVSKWNGSSRYEFWDPVSAATLLGAINDEQHGVLPWLKTHW